MLNTGKFWVRKGLILGRETSPVAISFHDMKYGKIAGSGKLNLGERSGTAWNLACCLLFKRIGLPDTGRAVNHCQSCPGPCGTGESAKWGGNTPRELLR